MALPTHVKVYFDFFGLDISDYLECELCQSKSIEIHHLKPRSLASREEVNKIDNLMAVCRQCHELCHNSTVYNTHAKSIHIEHIEHFLTT